MRFLRRRILLAMAPFGVIAAACGNETFSSLTDGGADGALTDASVAPDTATIDAGPDAAMTDAPAVTVVTLVALIDDPLSVAVGTSAVFFTTEQPAADGANGNLARVGFDGAALTPLASGHSCRGVSVDPSGVPLFVREGLDTVERVDPVGGSPLWQVSANNVPFATAANNLRAFWTNIDQPNMSSSAGYVSFRMFDGGVGTLSAPVAQRNPVAIAVDGSNVYWVNRGTAGNNFTDGEVRTCRANGANQLTLAAAVRSPQAIAIDDVYVYFPDGTGLYRMVTAGGPAVKIAANVGDVRGIAVDATSIYWVEYASAGAVRKTGKTGGSKVVTIADNQPYPTAIALSATDIFWANRGTETGTIGPDPQTDLHGKHDGAIMKANK